MAPYRENKKAIQWMTLICALGGCVFIAIGVIHLFKGFSWGKISGGGQEFQALPFVAAGINLIIGVASLLFSTRFHRDTSAWDLRLGEVSRSEDALKLAMEQQ